MLFKFFEKKGINVVSEMENSWDFLEWLGPDISISVLTHLDDLADIVRMSSVSRSWRHFVIENGFCKKLCIRMFPEVSRFKHVVEVANSMELIVGSSNSFEWKRLEEEHRAYAHLGRSLTSPMKLRGCIETSIRASSTDNFPEENIENTLDPSEKVDGRPSYWSSIGEEDPEVSETLTYKLKSQLCVVYEIKIKPFKATFQFGHPIYSSKAVRFRMGHAKSALDLRNMGQLVAGQRCTDDDNYIWTYVSPTFQMEQVNCLQKFTLPKPVICIGGILQIELLGRIQKQEMDELYYICVCHVEVIGQPLSPVFDNEILDLMEGNCVLKYSPHAEQCPSPTDASHDEGVGSSGWHSIAARIRQLRDGRAWNRVVILNALLGHVAANNDNDSDEEQVG